MEFNVKASSLARQCDALIAMSTKPSATKNTLRAMPFANVASEFFATNP
jgi:hypothetical protein